MIKTNLTGLLAVSLLVVQFGWAQIANTQTITKTGTTAASFLKIGVDARSTSMGNAYVAMPGDVNSIFWNPAGLAGIKGVEAAFNSSDWLASTDLTFIALAFNAPGVGVLGLSITQLSIPESPVLTVSDPKGTGELWDASDIAINLAFSRKLSDRFSLGVNAKYVQERIWHSSAKTMAVDIGALFVTPIKNIRLGATISNYGGTMRMSGRDQYFDNDPDPDNQGNVEIVNATYETDKFPLPLLFRVGISGELIQTANMRLSYGLDAMHPNDNVEAVNAGMEYAFAETFFLRGGYANLFNEDAEEGLSIGGGINYRIWGSSSILKVDYSYTVFNRLVGVPRVSVGVKF
ncbi:MAG: PorV/PorQ family protein [Candidatus Neomarinimicrobiota bacterium]